MCTFGANLSPTKIYKTKNVVKQAAFDAAEKGEHALLAPAPVAEAYLDDAADVAAAKATFKVQYDAIDNALNAPLPFWTYNLAPVVNAAAPVAADTTDAAAGDTPADTRVLATAPVVYSAPSFAGTQVIYSAPVAVDTQVVATAPVVNNVYTIPSILDNQVVYSYLPALPYLASIETAPVDDATDDSSTSSSSSESIEDETTTVVSS